MRCLQAMWVGQICRAAAWRHWKIRSAAKFIRYRTIRWFIRDTARKRRWAKRSKATPRSAAEPHRRACFAMKLVLASGNAHKAAEFAALASASGLPLEIVTAPDGMPAVVEDAGTFTG